MKAIRIHQFGGVDRMNWEEVETPSPSGSQVLVKIAAAGVNYIDIYQRKGIYPVPLPYTIGLEGAGTVEALGPEAAGFEVGDRVAFTSVPGAYAQYVLVPAEKLVHVPSSIDLNTAAACMLQGMTAQYLAHSTYKLKSSDTCLVHSGAGGVGLLLIQTAKSLGAQVITTVSTKEKAVLAKDAGADHVILYKDQDFESEVKKLTHDQGVQVIYDGVGKDTFMKGLNCLAPLGMMVLYGQSSGSIEAFDPGILAQKGSLFLTRPTLFHYTADRKSLEEYASIVFKLIESGQLKIRISEVFPMSDAATAHQKLEARQTTGKLLLVP